MQHIYLAPMKNITCWAFRNSFSYISDSYTEMLNLNSLLYQKEKALELIDTYEIPNQNQWLQILTHSLSDMKALPKFIVDFCYNYPKRKFIYGVNINACCPEPDIIRAGDGAALIKRTKRLINLFNTFLNSSNIDFIKISCKMRLGINQQEMKYKKVLQLLEEIEKLDDDRIAPTIIHFRHARQNSDSRPHWEYLEDILNCEYKIIINGGISTIDDVYKIQSQFQNIEIKKWKNTILGIMIGKAILKNPLYINSFLGTMNIKINLIDWKEKLIKGLERYKPSNRFITELNKIYHIK
ncbi:MAG: tRNA-dihydrouridine synthase family protein [Candidatus Lokiarchaeota archaeon]|nr:tRNA-dihydrouridine synthase family protein [Candidatus Lokiarchaeota archaeon]